MTDPETFDAVVIGTGQAGRPLASEQCAILLQHSQTIRVICGDDFLEQYECGEGISDALEDGLAKFRIPRGPHRSGDPMRSSHG